MKALIPQLIPVLLASFSLNAIAATTRYVDLNSSSPMPPYTNWLTAATNIQDAIDAAEAGDLVLVTNGVYNTGARLVAGVTTSNRIAITLPIIVHSVNGSEVTTIEGYQVPGTINGLSAVRCAYLTNGATLTGFTLTHGATTASTGGGGGVWFRTLSHTTSIVSNCVLIGNSAGGGGGGASGGGTLVACGVISNTAGQYGGGASGSTLIGCLLKGNSAGIDGGGSLQANLSNCLLVYNSAGRSGGADYAGKLQNCTITGNSAGVRGGGVANNGILDSCVVYFNNAPLGADYYDSGFRNCCTTTNASPAPFINCITNIPLFVDFAVGNFNLQSNSPCINAGYNTSVTLSTDLDGNSRIAGGTVDIGAYEFQSPSSLLSYAWAQQNGLPTDGSADFTDADGDGMNNYGEWRSDTNPTNSLSILRMVNATNSPSSKTVTWQSVSTRNYWLERATNLALASPFQTVATNIVGVAGMKTFTDTSTTNAGPYFYRVGVQ